MSPQLVDNQEQSRFELYCGDNLLGWVDYRPAGANTIIAHTEVIAAHQGEGLGGQLVRAALDELAARGQSVIAVCPFAEAYIRDNPELWHFVDPSLRPR
jgi:predicted GNAT family acetyltransferase